MNISNSGVFQAIVEVLGVILRIVAFAGIVSAIARVRNGKKQLEKPVTSTHVLCQNCGLANPSVWEKCERCGFTIGAPTPPSDEQGPPSLVKEI